MFILLRDAYLQVGMAMSQADCKMAQCQSNGIEVRTCWSFRQVLGSILLDKQAGLWVKIGVSAPLHVVLTRQGHLRQRKRRYADPVIFSIYLN